VCLLLRSLLIIQRHGPPGHRHWICNVTNLYKLASLTSWQQCSWAASWDTRQSDAVMCWYSIVEPVSEVLELWDVRMRHRTDRLPVCRAQCRLSAVCRMHRAQVTSTATSTTLGRQSRACFEHIKSFTLSSHPPQSTQCRAWVQNDVEK